MNKIDKLKAWFNILLILVGIDVILRTIGMIVYPLSYLLRKCLRWAKKRPILNVLATPLWVFLDDDGGDYGNPLENTCKLPLTNFLYKFISAYNWSAIRNPVWNIYKYSWASPKGIRSDIHFDYCETYTYGKDLLRKTMSNQLDERMNRAKFYSYTFDGQRTESTNEGDYIDLEKSLFGKAKYYFKQSGRWWVLYTYCDITGFKSGFWWFQKKKYFCVREKNIGLTNRVLVRNKWQRGSIEI